MVSRALFFCSWCRRELPYSAFPKIVDGSGARGRHCRGCSKDPIDPECKLLNLRWRVGVLAERWAQPSLFPSPLERVMSAELERIRAELTLFDETEVG
jgi:hypothetical protein